MADPELDPLAPRPRRPTIMRKKRAAALRYEHGKDPAPQVVAVGEGRLADRIIELAKEHGITIKEDPDLVELLCKLEVDQQIPPKLFIAVAEVMAFVYRVNRKMDELVAGVKSAGRR